MKVWQYFVAALLIVAFAFSRLAVFYNKPDQGIRDFVYQKDKDHIDALFHKDDNWYWLICDASMDTYSLDFTLKYKTSSQYEALHNLVLKVLEIDGKIAGFMAYYPNSMYTWNLLFLVVDPDYRQQGLAMKLLTYGVKDMVGRGAVKIDMVTRPVNTRARALYKKFGFKQLDEDADFVNLTWHKSWGMP